MASRARKRGKVVEEPVVEEKENRASRGRAGRLKKVINYAEDTPSPLVNKKKGKDKPKVVSKHDKNEIQNAETKSAQKSKTSKADTKECKAPVQSLIPKKPAPSKAKGKKKNIKEPEVDESAAIQTDENTITENDIEKDPVRRKTPSRNNKSKQNNRTKEVEDSEHKDKLVHEEEYITELDKSGVTYKTNDNKKRGKPTRKDKKDSKRKPLANRNDNSEEKCEDNIENEADVMNKKNSKRQKTGRTELIIDTDTNSQNINHDQSEPVTSDSIQYSNKKTKKTANNTFTLEDVPETPIMTKPRTPGGTTRINTPSSEQSVRQTPVMTKPRTPGRTTQINTPSSEQRVQQTPVMTKPRTPGRTTQINTPSSEQRVQQVKENLRNSLCGSSTPANSAHAECTLKMSQVYEILELVTEQLTDMKTEMESVKSSNEQMKTEIETTRTEYRRLKDEMNNVKNTAMNQNSPSNQNEIDLLWKQCDTQKKTIRSLHDEVDNAKQELNKKFEKYKKAMVFILCKTRPDVKHSDVSKLRHLLGKAEEHLDLTLDEICSTMESDLPASAQVKKLQAVPCPVITCEDTSKHEPGENIGLHEEFGRKRNVSTSENSTPKRSRNSLEAFQPKHRIKRTPVGNPSK